MSDATTGCRSWREDALFLMVESIRRMIEEEVFDRCRCKRLFLSDQMVYIDACQAMKSSFLCGREPAKEINACCTSDHNLVEWNWHLVQTTFQISQEKSYWKTSDPGSLDGYRRANNSEVLGDPIGAMYLSLGCDSKPLAKWGINDEESRLRTTYFGAKTQGEIVASECLL